jgi:hypothetical protein
MKQILGMDSVTLGTASIAHKFDASNPAFETPGVTVSGDTRPGGLVPVEICSTGIAPVITHQADELFELHALTYYFEAMGVQ